MKILVTELPNYFRVEDTCLFAKKTGEMIGGKEYSYLDECKCNISGRSCELQRYDECPYLTKVVQNER